MLSLSRKQPASGPAPSAGTVAPFGGAAPFPLVVLPGGAANAPEKPPGREVFDAYVRREARSGVAPRMALVQALAGKESPWTGPAEVASTSVASASPTLAKRKTMTVAPEPQSAPVSKTAATAPVPAQPAAPAASATSAPTPSPAKAKLRIATRASTPPFVMASSTPEGAASAPMPESPLSPLVPSSPLAPVPSWNESDMGSPMLPIPEPKVVLSAVAATPPRPEAGTRAAWPVQPPGLRVAPIPVAPSGAQVFLPAQGAPRKRSMWPAVAVLLLIATLLGAGEWWRRNAGGKTDGNVIVSVPVASSASATPAAVEPVAKEPSEAFRIWARNSRISGVRESETGQVRALVNGRLFLDGDLVDAALGLRLVGQSKTERRLIFEESGGARLEVAY